MNTDVWTHQFTAHFNKCNNIENVVAETAEKKIVVCHVKHLFLFTLYGSRISDLHYKQTSRFVNAKCY